MYNKFSSARFVLYGPVSSTCAGRETTSMLVGLPIDPERQLVLDTAYPTGKLDHR